MAIITDCASAKPAAPTDGKDVTIAALNNRIQTLESALYAALRLRGLSEAYHDNLALIGERKKYKADLNEIEAQIREALQLTSECKGK